MIRKKWTKNVLSSINLKKIVTYSGIDIMDILT